MLAILAGCTVQKGTTILILGEKENYPTKRFQRADSLNKTNRFTKQFQRADSMFNEKYLLR